MRYADDGMSRAEHVEDGVLLAYADAELAAGVAAGVVRHLDSCARCRRTLRRLRAADEMLRDALERLDDPPLRVAGARTAVRRRAKEPRTGRRRRVWRSVPRAAAAVIALAVGASAAVVPGSPVRQWIGDRLGTRPGADATTRAPDADLATDGPRRGTGTRAAVSGISVAAADGGVRIVVTDARPGAVLRIRHVDAVETSVLARSADDSLRFLRRPGEVRVNGTGDARITVVIPRSLARAAVDVNGRRYLVKDGSAITTLEPPVLGRDTLLVFHIHG